MLKEELEKQLEVKVSMAFYVTANGMYERGSYRNNHEFCEMLKQDKLLMVSLREMERVRSQVFETYNTMLEAYNTMHDLVSSINFLPR